MKIIIEKTLKLIYDEFIENTKKDCIILNPIREATSIFNSKLGGIPYLARDFKHPTIKFVNEERKLLFLLQINFDEMPNLKNFPKQGMLQIYIDNLETGMSSLDGVDNFKIMYHKEIDYRLKNENTHTFYEGLPFKNEYKLIGELNTMPMTFMDNNFNKEFMLIYKKYIDTDLKYYYDIDTINEEELEEKFSYKFISIGGYPTFCQQDFRTDEEYNTYDTLFLKIPSICEKDVDICWGDFGSANFFINEEDLKKCDFSRVVYNWESF